MWSTSPAHIHCHYKQQDLKGRFWVLDLANIWITMQSHTQADDESRFGGPDMRNMRNTTQARTRAHGLQGFNMRSTTEESTPANLTQRQF